MLDVNKQSVVCFFSTRKICFLTAILFIPFVLLIREKFYYFSINSHIYMVTANMDSKNRSSTVWKNESRLVENFDSTCLKQEALYNGAFCLSEAGSILTGGIFIFDGQLCSNIEALVQRSSVVDFGAGLGQYGRCFLRDFKQLNISNEGHLKLYKRGFYKKLDKFKLSGTPQVIASYEGFDGAINIEKITNNFIKRIDLAVQFDLGKRYDWVLSLEVGEHIPEESEETFMKNLIRHACKGIIMSWALPGQDGLGHVNRHSNEYVISKMKKLGLQHTLTDQKRLRNNLTIPYFMESLMVFRKVKRSC